MTPFDSLYTHYRRITPSACACARAHVWVCIDPMMEISWLYAINCATRDLPPPFILLISDSIKQRVISQGRIISYATNRTYWQLCWQPLKLCWYPQWRWINLLDTVTGHQNATTLGATYSNSQADIQRFTDSHLDIRTDNHIGNQCDGHFDRRTDIYSCSYSDRHGVKETDRCQ